MEKTLTCKLPLFIDVRQSSRDSHIGEVKTVYARAVLKIPGPEISRTILDNEWPVDEINGTPTAGTLEPADIFGLLEKGLKPMVVDDDSLLTASIFILEKIKYEAAY